MDDIEDLLTSEDDIKKLQRQVKYATYAAYFTWFIICFSLGAAIYSLIDEWLSPRVPEKVTITQNDLDSESFPLEEDES